MLRYSLEHIWVHETGDALVLGVSDYAVRMLGDVVFADLAQPGETVQTGGDFGLLESAKVASDLISPYTGVVQHVNTKALADLRMINRVPERDGWLIGLVPQRGAPVAQLLSAADYAAYTATLQQPEDDAGGADV